MTEDIKLRLTLDAAQAQQELAKTRQSAEKLGGGLETLQQTFKKGAETLSKQAAAFATLSLAMGEQRNAAGKAVQGAAQLAAAYGAGGPLMLALQAGAGVVGMLTKHWDDLIVAQDAAIASSFSAADRVMARSRQISDELHKLRVAATGIDDREAAIRGDLASTQARLTARTGAIGQLTGPAQQEAIQEVIILKRQMATLERNLEQLKEITKLKGSSGGGGTAATGELSYRVHADYGDYDSAGINAAYDERSKGELQAVQDLEDAKTRYMQEQSAIRLDLDKQTHDAMMANAALERAQLEADAQTYTQLAGSMAAALGALGAEVATGQNDALKHFLAAASQAAGGYISLEGGKMLAAGISELAFTGGISPHGWLLTAEGAALVAAGTAVSTGGPAAVQALMGIADSGSSGGGGGGGAARDPGIGGGRSGGHSSDYGGRTTINITYGGMSGPTADQGAEAVVGALRRAGRRGITPVEVR